MRKQRMLLRVVELAGSIERKRLVNVMFLLSRDPRLANSHPMYTFPPFSDGPTSLEMDHDIEVLQSRGYLTERNGSVECIIAADERIEDVLVESIKTMLQESDQRYDSTLPSSVRDGHPLSNVLAETWRGRWALGNATGFVTIGYQDRTIDGFLSELIAHEVRLVIDVRRTAVSRKYPFSKVRLKDILSRFDIDYLHMPGLGIDAEDRRNLRGDDDYQKLFEVYRGGLGNTSPLIDEIIQQGVERRLALMCYERDLDHCHRGVIAEMVRSRGFEVVDI
jgi:hypothetical protein